MSRPDTHAFRETGRKTSPTKFMESITLENDFYEVSLYYTGGDYEGAVASHTVNPHEFTISCTPKNANLTLNALASDCVVIQDVELQSISPQQVESVIRRLQIAKQSADALLDILPRYMA